MKQMVVLDVNDETHEVLAAENMTLLETLRETLGLTGSKRGCDMGTCGACTVLIDGRPTLSCMTLTVRTQGKAITTIEGLFNSPAEVDFDHLFSVRGRKAEEVVHGMGLAVGSFQDLG